MRLIVCVGARPNVIKVGSLLPALASAGIATDVAFTGSRSVDHPDDEGGSPDFYGISMGSPRWFLDVGSDTDAVQTGRAMAAFEDLFIAERPDAVLVVGDVNPTLAAAISAAKAGLPVVHLGAGERCGDLRLPEEINRVLISRVAAMHLTASDRALENLVAEGVDPERMHFVGNIMAESVIRHLDRIRDLDVAGRIGLGRGGYVLASFHRPETLAIRSVFAEVLAGLGASPVPVLMPDSSRLRDIAQTHGLAFAPNTQVIGAVEYQEMLALERDAACVITDSTGVQEEACTICTPCITVRECTELLVTLESGANRLCAADRNAISSALATAVDLRCTWTEPPRWDTAVSKRVVRALKRGVTPLS